MTRWEGESNENMYGKFGMETLANGVQCSAVEWVKGNTLRWLGLIERKKSEEREKKIYASENERPRR